MSITDTQLVNDADIVAEVTAMFRRYEAALMANDTEELTRLFWRSPLTLRYGVGEQLYGHDAISAFRVNRKGGAPRRSLGQTVITTFGRDFATANTEFQRENADRIGRQSQTWVRFPEGWRIVAAHVSLQGDTN
jgi:hypothetical protein